MKKILNSKIILVIIIATGLLFFLYKIGILRPVERLLLAVVNPVSEQLYTWGGIFRWSDSHQKNNEELVSEVEKLKTELARFAVANSRCTEIEAENEKLKGTLKFKENSNQQLVVARVISRGGLVDDDRSLVINRGLKDGLKIGLAVISDEGVVIGKVIAVKEAVAQVCLTTMPNCQLAASVQNQYKTQGVTNGDLGLTIKMGFIPQLEKLSGGDLIITSGLEADVPRGLFIGRVSQVRSESNDVWQEATIEPLVNLDNLTVVAVVLP